jgi:transposase
LTDVQRAALSPLLPPRRPRTGRPARDHHTVLSAIVWVLRTGAPWRDLPARSGPVIPRRSGQRPGDGRHAPFDRATYRRRNRVERLINRLERFRRIATRYEKRARHHVAMLTLAALLLWV